MPTFCPSPPPGHTREALHANLLPLPSYSPPQSTAGGNTVLLKGGKVSSQKANNGSGWSLPMHNANTTVIYAQTLSRLYAFYRCAGQGGGGGAGGGCACFGKDRL